MTRTVNRLSMKQVAAEKQAILDLLADGEEHSFREIAEVTGIKPEFLERRLVALRDKLEYLGREGVSSYWKLSTPPGEVSQKMREFPACYLRWGGWTA
jgi:DNA-binding IclR family transcriptional regulator